MAGSQERTRKEHVQKKKSHGAHTAKIVQVSLFPLLSSPLCHFLSALTESASFDSHSVFLSAKWANWWFILG